MPDVADYKVISDGDITLQTGGDIDRTFNFDLGTAVKHTQYVILQFFYRSGSSANNLNFQFSLNGTMVRELTVTGHSFSTIHEVQTNVTQDNANRLDIRIVGGTGSVRISDIVLFVQRSC